MTMNLRNIYGKENLKNIKDYIVQTKTSIRDAIKKLDAGGIGFLAIADDNNMILGVLTDGDFRRAILAGVKLASEIDLIMNPNFKHLKSGYHIEDAKTIIHKSKVNHIPILKNGELVRIIDKNSLFQNDQQQNIMERKLKIPVVIMAGGLGTRLDPFTRILPKPLIPIGDRAMIEVIMDEYAKYGMTDFFISINHKGKMIKAYLDESENPYSLNYISEEKPLGTAGALKFLDGKIDSCFFVSNCDILIDDDYTSIYEHHIQERNDLTIVGSLQHHMIPYGVCEIEKGGILKKFIEKPKFDFLVNTGMYLLNSDVLQSVPDNEYYHITDLIEKLKNKGKRVGVYPVSEYSYKDVGQWREYTEFVNTLNLT